MDENRSPSTPFTLLQVINQLLECGAVAVVVTAMSGVESVGAKLVVDETGRMVGTLGNSDLDSAVLSKANEFLKSREETRTFAVREFAPALATADEILLLFERLHPAPRLVICGAGHVGAALAKFASFVGYNTTLIDDRAEFLAAERFSGHAINLVLAETWTSAVQETIGSGRGVAVAVVTRGHREDEECMHAVIATNPDYVGLIGSKRRTSIVIDRLRSAGASEEQLQRIHAPIGLDIGAVSPEEVALAIIAEIVAERSGAKGGSLSLWRRS